MRSRRTQRGSSNRRSAEDTPPPRCVLDSGALTALCGASTHARAWLRWVTTHLGTIVVPAPILVESTTGDGARDAEVNRILGVLSRASSAVTVADEAVARRAARLRFRAKSDDGIEALVAAEAMGHGAPTVLLTSDPDDLERLLADASHVVVRKV